MVCGRGNNAGDGYIVAGCARIAGIRVQLIQLGRADALTGDAARARDWAVALGLAIEEVDAERPRFDCDGGVIVDALLGTGVTGDVRPGFAAAIDLMQRCGRPLLALDIPSGLCSDTGRVLGRAVRADVTVNVHWREARPRHRPAGRITRATSCSIRWMSQTQAPSAALPALVWSRQRASVPRRAATAYKHQSGHVLVIGGDRGMGGAVAMAAEAALRVGAGLASVVTRPEHVAAVLARRPEIMVRGVDELLDHRRCCVARANVIAIGPGLGRDDWGRALLDRALQADKPLVVDADALPLLAADRARAHARRVRPSCSRRTSPKRPRCSASLSRRFSATGLRRSAALAQNTASPY